MGRFKVGDLVRVRDWDDMVKEFGTKSSGDIAVPFVFTKDMREYCGKESVIVRIVDRLETSEIVLDERDGYFGLYCPWTFSEEMLERAYPKDFFDDDYMTVLDTIDETMC